MVQFTTEQRTFIVKKVYETGNLQTARDEFHERFLDRQPPALKTIWAKEEILTDRNQRKTKWCWSVTCNFQPNNNAGL